MKKTSLLAIFVISSSLFASAASAQVIIEAGEADCSTPRRALYSWLHNLMPAHRHPQPATRCFDWLSAGIQEQATREERAEQLKRLLDARGLYVRMSDIPDDPTLEDDETRYRPFPSHLPIFQVVQRGETWLISGETVRATPTLLQETVRYDIEGLVEGGPSWLRSRFLTFAWWQIIALLLLIFVGLVLRTAITYAVSTWGAKVAVRVLARVEPKLLQRAASPIGTVAMVLFMIQVFPALQFGVDVNRVFLFGLRVAAAVSGVLIIYRLVDVLSDMMAKRASETETKLDDQLVPLVRKSLKTITVVLGFIFVLQNLEIDVASLIAGVSLGGLAFTLAARDTVANLFGSISIFADQPFQIGDWVNMQGVEGIVEEVGMRSTRVRTFYRSVAAIPNSKIADGVVDNYGSRDGRRLFTKLGVQYDTTPEQLVAFCDGIRAILARNDAVKKDNYFVYFSGFNDSSLEVMVYLFLDVAGWDDELKNKHIIFLEILRLARDLGVQFAFPTRTLHLATRAKEAEIPAPTRPSIEELGATVLAFGPGGDKASLTGPEISHGFFPARDVVGGSKADDEAEG